MKEKGCRCDTELSSAADSADPFHDEIYVEREVAGPIPIVRIACTKFDGPNVTVVPGEMIEVRLCISHGLPAQYCVERPVAARVTGLLSFMVHRNGLFSVIGHRARNRRRGFESTEPGKDQGDRD